MSMHSEWKTAKKALDAAGIPTKKLFKRKDLVKELTNFEEAHKAVEKIPGCASPK